jgi:hypothetical protein
MLCKTILAIMLLISSATAAVAAPMIVAGNHVLLPNTAGQKIMIMTSGEEGDEFQGVDLHLAIGDGGPIVTGIDLIGPDTLLFGNNMGQIGYFDPLFDVPTRIPAMTATTAAGTIGPNGVLAVLTLDTTGITPGQYSLSLTHPEIGPSDLPMFFETTILQDGFLTVLAVPEPSSIVLALIAAGALGAATLRRRQARRQVALAAIQ